MCIYTVRKQKFLKIKNSSRGVRDSKINECKVILFLAVIIYTDNCSTILKITMRLD